MKRRFGPKRSKSESYDRLFDTIKHITTLDVGLIAAIATVSAIAKAQISSNYFLWSGYLFLFSALLFSGAMILISLESLGDRKNKRTILWLVIGGFGLFDIGVLILATSAILGIKP
jgi:uncharacterized membrane protein YgdD (TMEM256/DUF423 family)